MADPIENTFNQIVEHLRKSNEVNFRSLKLEVLKEQYMQVVNDSMAYYNKMYSDGFDCPDDKLDADSEAANEIMRGLLEVWFPRVMSDGQLSDKVETALMKLF